MTEFTLFVGKNIVMEDYVLDGGILVSANGRIEKILNREDVKEIILTKSAKVSIIDAGSDYLMYGIIDSHVHVNEPGRTQWEGFETATKAAAAGGITTIVDMPLNAIPPTTNVENFKTKLEAADGQIYVDVAFWGGLIHGNQGDLLDLVEAGVVGFKCFMCHSGVDEFPKAEISDIEDALKILDGVDTVLAFHAELEEDIDLKVWPFSDDPYDYDTYLQSRPPSMEINAISVITSLAQKYRVKTHIVHLSTAEAIPLIAKAQAAGAKLTTETCHHYLNITSENIKYHSTHFKCAPPIRNSKNQDSLWQALKDGVISMVVSDHSPCTPDLKFLSFANNNDAEYGNFMKAWGGIASVQFGLPLFWTGSRSRGLGIFDVNKYMTRAPAQLTGLHKRKGRIAVGYDADFVVWDPQATIKIEEPMILHKNKVTPYIGKELLGKVIKTYIRGKLIYENGTEFGKPQGNILLKTHLD